MKSNFKKTLALLLAIVMLLGTFAGCGKKAEAPVDEPKQEETTTPETPDNTEETDAPEVEAPATSDTLVVGYDPFSQKFSPFFSDTSYDMDAQALTQIGLLSTDREGNVVEHGKEGQVIPYNGTDYTYYSLANVDITENADGTVTYAFDMRDDVTFSDGEPVTADDVIFNMYVYSDPTFDGSATFYAQPIVGMEEYRSGMSTKASLIAAAGKENADFTFWTEEEQTAFWADMENATAFCQEIVDYCIEAGYGTNVAESAAAWNFAGLEADATAFDFLMLMGETYGWNFSQMENESAGSALADLITPEVYNMATEGVQTGSGAANIAGIVKTGDYSLEVTMSKVDPTAIYHLGVTVAPMHYYGDPAMYDYENNMFGFTKGDLSTVRDKTTKPMGAGPYKFISYENGVVSFEANENYFLGAPKIKNLKMQEVQESDKITGMTTDLFDLCQPSFGPEQVDTIVAANPNGELVGEKITTVATDFLGYGYIGINAENVKVGDDKASAESKALRKALATLFAVYRDPIISTYYGERASVIQYPISNTSWAAPKPSDEGYNLAYSKNADGEVVITSDMNQEQREAAAKEAAISLLKFAGYTWDEAAGMFTAAPAGAAMEYEIIIPANGNGDHPAYGILTETKNALAEMGLNLIINDPADPNELWDAQDTGTCEMWAAAWGATPDPDMYQVYHSSNVVSAEGGSHSNKYDIQDPELDAMIIEARSTTDQAFRKATYKACLELIMDWGVEIPTYQRQECTLFSTERVNVDTIPADMTPFYGWYSEIEKLEMN